MSSPGDSASRIHLAVWSAVACNAGAATTGAVISLIGLNSTHLMVGGVVALASLGSFALRAASQHRQPAGSTHDKWWAT